MLVGSRNGLECDFTTKLKLNMDLMEEKNNKATKTL